MDLTALQHVRTDMFERYVAVVRDGWWLWAITAALGLLWVFGRGPLSRLQARLQELGRLSESTSARVTQVTRWSLLGVTAVAGLLWAWELRWLCDDAFISFRYANNLARGDGLVFNIGERVEGYTNFLWTVILAAFIRMGLDVGQVSIVLSFAAFVALLVLVHITARRLAPAGSDVVISIAATLCAAHYTMASFATSGLETMLGALLAMVLVERATAGRYVAAGLAGVLAAMTHPDHGIFYAGMGAALLLGRDSRRGLLQYAVPFAVVYLPYFAWRYSYYGDLFPNTYYAKSASDAYFEQGGVYVGSFWLGGGLWAGLPLMFYGWLRTRGTVFGRYCLIALPLFMIYVAKIGGDFMYGRLFTPMVAPLLLLAETGLRHLLSRERRVTAALLIVLLSVIAVPGKLFLPLEKRWKLSDERTFYLLKSYAPIEVASTYAIWAKVLTKYFEPHRDRPHLCMACVGMIGFYTGWPLLDGFGLTDRVVAHHPIAKRTRPGHEKHASPAYIAARDVDISDVPAYPGPYSEMGRITLDHIPFHLIHYDRALLEPLRERAGVKFTPIEDHLKKLGRKPIRADNSEEVACDAWFLQEYFFSRQPRDPARGRFLRRLLQTGLPDVTQVDAVLAKFESTHRPEPSTAFHFDGSEADRFDVIEGLQAAIGVTVLPVPQDLLKNHQGAVINTFLPETTDTAQGRLVTKPFPIVGDLLELWIGGGRHHEGLRVSLVVDGQRVLSAGGCGSEILARRLWHVAQFKGQSAVLEIIDHDARGWGHLVVDEVVQWVPKTPSAEPVQ